MSPFKGQQGAVDKLKLSCLGVTLEVNKSHFDKLRVLYAYTVQRTNGHYDASAFTQAAMAVLLRYSSLQGTHHRGGGFQVRNRTTASLLQCHCLQHYCASSRGVHPENYARQISVPQTSAVADICTLAQREAAKQPR